MYILFFPRKFTLTVLYGTVPYPWYRTVSFIPKDSAVRYRYGTGTLVPNDDFRNGKTTVPYGTVPGICIYLFFMKKKDLMILLYDKDRNDSTYRKNIETLAIFFNIF